MSKIESTTRATLYETDGETVNKVTAERAVREGVSLACAYLRWADLRWADLCWADLRGADLRWANLLDADLYHADLRWANLRGADLRGADLTGADLTGADLRGADMRDATIDAPASKYSWVVVGDVLTYGCESMTLDEWESRIDSLSDQHEEHESARWHKIYLRALIGALREWKENI